MIDLIFAAIALIVALGALGGWAATLVHLNRSILPNAQAIQALNQVNNIMDDRIRSVLANFEKRSAKQPESTKPVNELEEIQRRAAAMGFSMDAKGNVNENRLVRPAPEPSLPEELANLPIVE
jgi:predicted RND superfamily exporter protein